VSDNDRIILRGHLEASKNEIAPELTDSDYFEIFTAEQVLKQYDLSYEEMQSGIVGGGGDGGIDSIYVFVNGSLILDDTDTSSLGRDLNIVVFINQSTRDTGFSEDTILRFQSTFCEVFDLSRDMQELSSVYNENLLTTVARFRSICHRYTARLPKIRFRFNYITQGDEVHPNVSRLVANLRNEVIGLFSTAGFSFDFVGVADLLTLARQEPTTSFSLKLAENPISSGVQSFVCLVNLVDFYSFISDNDGALIRRVFEANVRDY
jgi:hypothetical protein